MSSVLFRRVVVVVGWGEAGWGLADERDKFLGSFVRKLFIFILGNLLGKYEVDLSWYFGGSWVGEEIGEDFRG